MNFRETNQTTADKIRRKKAIVDALKRRRAQRLRDSRKDKKYSEFHVTDSYKNLLKKIKDNMSETESTEEAINVAIEALADAPAEQVVSAAIEVLGETIDKLQESVSDTDDND